MVHTTLDNSGHKCINKLRKKLGSKIFKNLYSDHRSLFLRIPTHNNVIPFSPPIHDNTWQSWQSYPLIFLLCQNRIMLFIVLLYLKYIVSPLSIHYSLEYPRLLLKVCSFLCYFVRPFHSIEHLTLRMLHPLFRHILKSFHPFLCFLSHYHFHHFHSQYWHFIHFNFENIRCIGTVHTKHRSG